MGSTIESDRNCGHPRRNRDRDEIKTTQMQTKSTTSFCSIADKPITTAALDFGKDDGFGRDGIRLDGALVRGVGLGICFFYFLIFIFFN